MVHYDANTGEFYDEDGGQEGRHVGQGEPPPSHGGRGGGKGGGRGGGKGGGKGGKGGRLAAQSAVEVSAVDAAVEGMSAADAVEALCPTVRFFAGPVGSDRPAASGVAAWSPLVLELQADLEPAGGGVAAGGLSTFSVPLLAVAPHVRPGEWSRVVLPLGESGWGGGHAWNHVRLVLEDGVRSLPVYVGRAQLRPRGASGEVLAVSSNVLQRSDAAQGGGGGDLTEETAALVESQGAAIVLPSGNATAPGRGLPAGAAASETPAAAGGQGPSGQPPAELVDIAMHKRYLFKDGELDDGMENWSWYADTDIHQRTGSVCADTAAFGGLSLKSRLPFARAYAVEFALRPAPTMGQADQDEVWSNLTEGINVRLDATSEKIEAHQAEEAAPWQTFVTSKLLPMSSLVDPAGPEPSFEPLLRASLPLFGLGNHTWDRISWVDATGEGSKFCVSDIAVVYALAPVEGIQLQQAAAESATLLSALCNTPNVNCTHMLPVIGSEGAPAKSLGEQQGPPQAYRGGWGTELEPGAAGPGSVAAGLQDAEAMSLNEALSEAEADPETELAAGVIVGGVFAGLALSATLALAALFVLNRTQFRNAKEAVRKRLDRVCSRKGSLTAHSLSVVVEGRHTVESIDKIPLGDLECDFDYTRSIGRGSTCAVFHGTWKLRDVAIKAINLQGAPGEAVVGTSAIFRELENLPVVDSEYVLRLLAYAHGPKSIYLVLEYCRHGNVQSLMHQGALELDLPLAVTLLLHVVRGLRALNEAGLTHRDVKSSNVLLKCKCGGGSSSRLNCTCLSGGGTLRALVGDLGVSKRIAQDATVQMMYAEARAETFAGTPRWMAPERLAVSEGNLSGDLGGEEGGGGFSRASTFRGQESSSRLAGEKSDVYSFGILAWELLWYMYQGYYQVPFSEFDASSSFALGEYNSEFDNTEFETQEEARRVPGRGAAGPSRLVQSVQAAPTSAKDRRKLLASLSGRMGGTSPGSSKGTADSLGGSPPAALYDRILRGIRPTIPQCCDPRLRDLVKACWHGEATARPRLDVIQRTLEGLLASVATASLFE